MASVNSYSAVRRLITADNLCMHHVCSWSAHIPSLPELMLYSLRLHDQFYICIRVLRAIDADDVMSRSKLLLLEESVLPCSVGL